MFCVVVWFVVRVIFFLVCFLYSFVWPAFGVPLFGLCFALLIRLCCVSFFKVCVLCSLSWFVCCVVFVVCVLCSFARSVAIFHLGLVCLLCLFFGLC